MLKQALADALWKLAMEYVLGELGKARVAHSSKEEQIPLDKSVPKPKEDRTGLGNAEGRRVPRLTPNIECWRFR